MTTPAAAQVSPPPQAPSEPLYAGFWRRVAAYVLDNLVLIIPMIVVAILLNKREGWQAIAQLAIWWTYKSGMESSAAQATLGKRAMGIKVVDTDGERISFARATARFLASFVSGILLGFGYLMAGFTARRQALHDMIASTLVVRAGAAPSEVPEGAGTMPMSAGVWTAIIVLLVFPFGIGLLAAIAIPAYLDYAMRAKMFEAVMEGMSVRTDAASEIRAFKQSSSAAPGSLHKVSRMVDPTSQYVKSIVINYEDGLIVVNLRGSKFASSGVEPGAQVVLDSNLKKSDTPSWTCHATGVQNKYLPAVCRQ